MANQTHGRPTIIGTVLRSDARPRPVAREPSLYQARGFPTMVGHCQPGPGPRPDHPSPTTAYRKRNTKRRRSLSPMPGNGAAPVLGRSCRTTGVPSRLEILAVARARFNTGLTP